VRLLRISASLEQFECWNVRDVKNYKARQDAESRFEEEG
jgi:hypothetical protein